MPNHLRVLLLAFAASLPGSAGPLSFGITGLDSAGPWTKIFASVGIPAAPSGSDPYLQVIGPNAGIDVAALSENHIVVVQGFGPVLKALGFIETGETVQIRQISDVIAPKTSIIWEQPVSMAAVRAPADYQVFAREKWKGRPVLAGKRTAHGAILWVATEPGPSGFERYPYLLQALVESGLNVPLRSAGLWAFFDSSYRLRADPDYLARRWRQSGISVLHVAAWHNVEPDPTADAFLRNLILACHRNAILVYAWLELPHVSEKFWEDHPQWREKTAVGQDAQLDWRKLMNLQNADCRRAVSQQSIALLNRFDWDGVNIAELYFESLEGASNPARFTPMNDEVRAEFKQIAGFDPKLLFDPASSYSASKNPRALQKFLDFRAILTSRMQGDWLKEMDSVKAVKPYLDVVLTHIDDRFDPAIRSELGADVSRALPIVQARHDTLLVEDPATLWNLGPERYAKLAQKYHELTADTRNLAVDINVVERYQDVYPTKKQTGVELFQLVHQAAESFSHVALYFENSLEKQDLPLLPASAATAQLSARGLNELEFQGREQTRVAWDGPLLLDGKPWPVQDHGFALIPAGHHVLSPGVGSAPLTLTDFNGEIHSAVASETHVDLSYSSRSRAIVTLTATVSSVEVDGSVFWKVSDGQSLTYLVLPSGQHIVSFNR